MNLTHILNQELSSQLMLDELTNNKIDLSEIRLTSQELNHLNAFLDFLKRDIQKTAIGKEIKERIKFKFDKFAITTISQVYFLSLLEEMGINESSRLITIINYNRQTEFHRLLEESKNRKRLPPEYNTPENKKYTKEAIKDFFKAIKIEIGKDEAEYYINTLNEYLY